MFRAASSASLKPITCHPDHAKQKVQPTQCSPIGEDSCTNPWHVVNYINNIKKNY